MNTKFYFIAAPVILSVGIILTLLAIAENNMEKPNGFSRRIVSGMIRSTSTIDLKYANYYFAGSDENKVYLANNTAYGLLMQYGYKTGDSTSLFMQMPAGIQLNTAHITTFVKDTCITMIDNITPVVLHGNTNTLSPTPIQNLSSPCLDPVAVSGSRIVAKIYDSIRQQNDLAIMNETKATPAHALVKKIDGKFCTDGRLLQDNVTGQLAYLYFYRNQFISLDSNLRVIYSVKTIDTITQSPFTLGTIHQGKAVTFSSPPNVVNRWAAMSNGKMFILSNRKADNEKPKDYNNNDVIDLYDVSRKQYVYSFYLPHEDDSGVRQYIVYKNYLFALSGTRLRIVALDLHD